MVAINDFCWNAFLTKSVLFLKFAPLEKKTPAPLSVLPILEKIALEIEDRFYVKTPFFLVFFDIASFQRKIIKSEIDFK